MKFIENPFEFFVMSDYNFSLVGALFGFFIVLLINTKLEKTSIKKYIDGLTLSFLFIMIIWYIGALLGGQVYGRETTLWIEILYTHSFTPVPYEVPIFPLAIIYSALSFILFSALYMLSMFVSLRGFIGYLWMILFGCVLLVWEFFSGKFDIFKLSFLNMNLTQICAFIIIVISGVQLYKVMKSTTSSIIQKADISAE